MNKWLIGIITAVIVIPGITFVLAAPGKLKNLEEAVVQQAETDKDIKNLYIEQKVMNERQDVELRSQREITAAQLEALKAIVLEINN